MPLRPLLRDLDERDEAPCSTGVSLFAGLGLSILTGADALTVSGSRVLVDFETGWLFNPSAARAPPARIWSSVSVAEADFFSRAFDSSGARVSRPSSSEC